MSASGEDMVQPPDAETEQGKVFAGEVPLILRDGYGQGKSAVEELVPKGVQAVEKQKDFLFKLLRRMPIFKAGMVEDAKEFIVQGVVGGQILVLLPGGDVLMVAFAEPFAVGLSEEDMHLMPVAIWGPGRPG